MLSSKSREKKKVDQKEQSRFCKELNPSLGCTTCKYGPYTVIYGQNLKYGTGYTAYRNTAYIRSYGLGQPYICVYGAGRQKAESPDRKQRAAHVRGV